MTDVAPGYFTTPLATPTVSFSRKWLIESPSTSVKVALLASASNVRVYAWYSVAAGVVIAEIDRLLGLSLTGVTLIVTVPAVEVCPPLEAK